MANKFFDQQLKELNKRFRKLSKDDKEGFEPIIVEASQKLRYGYARQLSSLMSKYDLQSTMPQIFKGEAQIGHVITKAYFVGKNRNKWKFRTKFYIDSVGLYDTLYKMKKGQREYPSVSERAGIRQHFREQNLIWQLEDSVLKVRPYGWKPGDRYVFERAGEHTASNWKKSIQDQYVIQLKNAFVGLMTKYLKLKGK